MPEVPGLRSRGIPAVSAAPSRGRPLLRSLDHCGRQPLTAKRTDPHREMGKAISFPPHFPLSAILHPPSSVPIQIPWGNPIQSEQKWPSRRADFRLDTVGQISKIPLPAKTRTNTKVFAGNPGGVFPSFGWPMARDSRKVLRIVQPWPRRPVFQTPAPHDTTAERTQTCRPLLEFCVESALAGLTLAGCYSPYRFYPYNPYVPMYQTPAVPLQPQLGPPSGVPTPVDPNNPNSFPPANGAH